MVGVYGAVKALPARRFDQAWDCAKQAWRGSLLAGTPIAIKDLTDVAGVRTS